MASRAELIASDIKPALERGEVVLADRFFLSTYAYQIAGRGLPESEVTVANRFATGGLVPDLTTCCVYPSQPRWRGRIAVGRGTGSNPPTTTSTIGLPTRSTGSPIPHGSEVIRSPVP